MTKRFVKGQKFIPSAAMFNGFLDASEWVRKRKLKPDGEARKKPVNRFYDIEVMNATTYVVDIYSPMIIGEPIYKPEDNFKINGMYFFKGEKITEENYKKPFCIALDSALTNQYVKAVVSGVVPARIQIKDYNHEYVRLTKEGTLESAASGPARILWISDEGSSETLDVWSMLLLNAPVETDSYSGFFKAVDDSEYDDQGQISNRKVKVVDGHDPEAAVCGYAAINGYQFEISSVSLPVSGTGYIVLQTQMKEKEPDVPELKFITDYTGANSDEHLRVIARVFVRDGTMEIVQEQHGSIEGAIWGECESEESEQ